MNDLHEQFPQSLVQLEQYVPIINDIAATEKEDKWQFLKQQVWPSKPHSPFLSPFLTSFSSQEHIYIQLTRLSYPSPSLPFSTLSLHSDISTPLLTCSPSPSLPLPSLPYLPPLFLFLPLTSYSFSLVGWREHIQTAESHHQPCIPDAPHGEGGGGGTSLFGKILWIYGKKGRGGEEEETRGRRGTDEGQTSERREGGKDINNYHADKAILWQ